MLEPRRRRRRRHHGPRRSRLHRPARRSESGTSGVPAPADHDRPTPPTGRAGAGGDGGGRGREAAPAAPRRPEPEPGGARRPDRRRRPRRRREHRPAKPDRIDEAAAATTSDEDDADDGGTRAADGSRGRPQPRRLPDRHQPRLTIADFGPAPIGVPNFVIDQFAIPPFLLPIYQACGTEYGIPWQVLASINRIETAFGTNLNVSSAGALGWMQFMPSTWEAYGVDANDDGRKDPYNPVDAICAAARYLKAAGGAEDLRTAIFAYNHADWYVDEVLLYANQYGKLPDDLVGSLTGLTEGAHFPVAADARYADDISEREALKRSKPGKRRRRQRRRRDLELTHPPRDQHLLPRGRSGRRRQRRRDHRDRQSRSSSASYIVLQDAYGNRYTYAELGEVSEVYPVPKENDAHRQGLRARHARGRGRRTGRPSAGSAGRRDDASPRAGQPRRGRRPASPRSDRARRPTSRPSPRPSTPRTPASASSPTPSARPTPSAPGSPASSTTCSATRVPGYETFKSYFSGVFELRRRRRWSCDRCARSAPRSSAAPCSAASAPRADGSPRTSTSRSGPPAAARRRSTRSRSSTAGSCSRPPRSTAPPARTRSAAPSATIGQILLMSQGRS